MKDMGRSDPPPFFWRAIIVWRWNSAGGPRDLQRSGRQSRVRDLARRRADHDPGDGDFLFEPGSVNHWFANCELHRSLRKRCPTWDRRLVSGVVITSEARNLLLLAPERPLKRQRVPHGLKAVRDDNSKSRSRPLLAALNNLRMPSAATILHSTMVG